MTKNKKKIKKSSLNFFLKETCKSATGKDRDRLSAFGFHSMTWAMKIFDKCIGYSSKNFKTLDLRPGQTVIDYGCGYGRYIELASAAVGDTGRVIAVDIHPAARNKVEKIIRKKGLSNVEFVLANGYTTDLESCIGDVLYALEVFHMIKNPLMFLTELGRLTKNNGVVIVEDGHQSRADTIRKIKNSGVFKIVSENSHHVKCRKIL